MRAALGNARPSFGYANATRARPLLGLSSDIWFFIDGRYGFYKDRTRNVVVKSITGVALSPTATLATCGDLDLLTVDAGPVIAADPA